MAKISGKNDGLITLSTPFAGKEYCFGDYSRGILNLDYPKNKIFFLALDNSRNKEFGKKIDKLAEKAGFADYRRLIYDKEPFTIEKTSDYAKVCSHCHNIYCILEKHLPEENEFTFNIEDDVEVPPDSLKKLLKIFEMDKKVGTAVGSCCSRRLKDELVGYPVAWKFRETIIFPYQPFYTEPAEALRIITAPPFGIEIIGSAHLGCWLTKTRLIKEISFKDLCGLGAVDVAWGYKLNKKGYYFVIDWSVKTKHYWLYEGKKGYYD